MTTRLPREIAPQSPGETEERPDGLLMESASQAAGPRLILGDNPFHPAQLRGEKARVELLAAEGGARPAAEVSKLLALSPKEVESWRAAGRLLAVQGETPGYSYPSWQFSGRGLLPGLAEVLEDLRGHDLLAQVLFFLQSNLRLHGKSPLHELRRGKVEEVRRAARNYGE